MSSVKQSFGLSEKSLQLIEERLRQAILKSPPPTPTEFAAGLGVPFESVRLNFPELVGQLITRRQKTRETPLKIQRRKILKDLIPVAENLTRDQLIEVTGIPASYLDKELSNEYEEIAKHLKRPRQEAAAKRREDVDNFALELSREFVKHGWWPTHRELQSALPSGLPRNVESVKRALKTARETLGMKAQRSCRS